MRAENMLLMGAAFLGGFALSHLHKKQKNVAAAKLFIDEALSKGLTAIQNARLAIQNSNSTNLKIFAQKIADDYATFNQRLLEIARDYNIVTNNVDRYQQASSDLLSNYNDSGSFDQNYVDRSLDLNSQMVNFLEVSARQYDSTRLRELVDATRQQLERHFTMANELAETLHTNSIPTSSPQSTDPSDDTDYKI